MDLPSQSSYVGAEVLTNRNTPLAIGFKHVNSSGYKVVTFEYRGDPMNRVVCTDGIKELEQFVRFAN